MLAVNSSDIFWPAHSGSEYGILADAHAESGFGGFLPCLDCSSCWDRLSFKQKVWTSLGQCSKRVFF